MVKPVHGKSGMARSTSDEEIRLRKRARRRLIGAIALTILVVVTLPMILDSEPRPIGDDIAVQIPSPNAGPYAPKGQPADPEKALTVPKAQSGATAVAPAPTRDAADQTGREAAKVPAKASGAIGSAVAPGDKEISVAGAARRSGDAAFAPAAKPATTSAGPAPSARQDTPAAGKAVSGAAETVRPAVAASAAEAKSGKDAAGEAKGSGTFVIQLGAFSEANRAKDRHAQLLKAGVRSYTEVIKTPTGDKTRVRAGPFPTREAADKANERLKTLGLTDGAVVPRRY